MEHKDIHEAIAAVMGEVGYIQKEQGGNLKYTYAGEAALIQAVRPEMVKHGIYCHVIAITNVQRERYKTSGGTEMVLTWLVVTVRYTHAPSGTYVDAQAIGEGADPGDKSAPKSLTGGFKYTIRETFCLETGDDPDKQGSEVGKTQDDDKGESRETKARVAPTCHYCGCVMEERTSKSKANPGRKFFACVNEICQRQRDEDGNEHGMFRCWCDATDYKDKP
jgi:hypothetical protein